jgi:hypothetical protein
MPLNRFLDRNDITRPHLSLANEVVALCMWLVIDPLFQCGESGTPGDMLTFFWTLFRILLDVAYDFSLSLSTP